MLIVKFLLTRFTDAESSPFPALNSALRRFTDGNSAAPISSLNSVRLSGMSISLDSPNIWVCCGFSRMEENPESMERLGERLLTLSSAAWPVEIEGQLFKSNCRSTFTTCKIVMIIINNQNFASVAAWPKIVWKNDFICSIT